MSRRRKKKAIITSTLDDASGMTDGRRYLDSLWDLNDPISMQRLREAAEAARRAAYRMPSSFSFPDPSRTILIDMEEPPMPEVRPGFFVRLYRRVVKALRFKDVSIRVPKIVTIKGKYRERLRTLADENVKLKYELRKLKAGKDAKRIT